MKKLNQRKFIAIIALIIALVSLPFQPVLAVETETTVNFTDPNLEEVIRSTLNLGETEVITESNIKQVDYISGSNSNISSLNGLEYATNLKDIWIPMNEISDLTPLSNLESLEDLTIYKNNISDLTPLKGLPNLLYLNLSDNQIADYSPLLEIPNLKSVRLEGNVLPNEEQKDILFQLRDKGVIVYFDGIIHPIGNMYLTSITDGSAMIHWSTNSWNTFTNFKIYVNDSLVGDFQKDDSPIVISDLTPSTTYEVRIDGLNANGEIIDDAIRSFTTLAPPEGEVITFVDKNSENAIRTELNIMHRDIYSSELATLYKLTLKNYGITNISDIDQISKLSELVLNDNTIQDVTALANLEQLRSLSMSNNNITDISSYAGLTQIESLRLANNNISNITPLGNLTNLKTLMIANNNISDLSPIASLQGLTTIEVSGNPIESYEPITKLQNLKTFYANNLGIQDISFLSQLPNLERVHLDKNNITDLSVLEQLPNLKYLSIENNGLELFTGFEHYEVIKRLKDKGVTVYTEEKYLDSSRTDYSITLSWDKLKEKGVFTSYEMYLNDKLVATLTGDQVTYTFEDLTPLTYYNIDVKAYIGDQLGYTEDISQSTAKTTWNGIESPKEDQKDTEPGEFLFVDPTVIDGVSTVPNLMDLDIKEGSTIYVNFFEYNLNKTHLKLPANQVEKLKSKNAKIVVTKADIQLTFPVSNLPTNGAADIIIDKAKWKWPLLNQIVSNVYDFTVIQDSNVISKFDSPVRLIFKVDSTKVSNPKNLGVYYFNESTEEWEPIGGLYNSHSGYISAETNHFSTYAVLEIENKEDDSTKPDSSAGNGSNNNSSEDNSDTSIEQTNKNIDSDSENTSQTTTSNANGTSDTTNKESEGKPLPDTAINTYNYLAIGFGLILLAVGILIVRRRFQTK